jgi:hypothetical protein
MNIRFYLDPTTGQPHILEHGVDEKEVQDVLKTPGEDRPGRYLRVIYVPDPEPESVFVVTAYELRGKSLLAYRRRKRTRRI